MKRAQNHQQESVNSTAMIVAADTATTVAPVAGIAPFQSVSAGSPAVADRPESAFNPRKDFKPGELDELTVSIRNQGVLSDILVRPKQKAVTRSYSANAVSGPLNWQSWRTSRPKCAR